MIIIKKYPIVLQDELKDCGVSCIQMILKYYKGNVRKSTLIQMTKTDKSGTTAFNIKETFIKLGFESKGIRCNLEDIKKENIILPCIASVIIDSKFKHFIVIYEINFNKRYLIVGDPSSKIKKISFEEFEKIFNHVLIISYPISKIPEEKDINIKQFLFHLIIPHKQLLRKIFIFSIFTTLFSILTSFYIQFMIKSIDFNSTTSLTIVFIIFFSLYMLKILTNFIRNKLLLYINQKLDLVLTLDTFKKIIMLPYSYYQNKTTGDIVSRISDLESIRDLISRVALSIFIDLPLTLLSAIVLLLINKTLFIISLVIVIFYVLIILIFKNPFNNYIRNIQDKKGNSISYMVESISGFETIKGIHIKDNIINKFEKKYVKYLKDVFNYQNLYILENLFKEIISDIGYITTIFVGFILVLNNKLDIGVLFTFIALLTYFLEPIKNIINLDNLIKESKNILRRILDIITYDEKNTGIVSELKSNKIEYKNFNFSYDDRNYILKNINLKIKENSKVMVIGKSGSGKSTLFKVLMKYYPVNSNKVFIGNVDLNDYKNIGNNIVYVSQNEILFNDTLYNNLVFDNDENLIEVSKMCYLDKILDNNLGYNMLIEENGFNLSGGEKQRIFLARALLRNFEILIIDEGLSQVDVDMERKILKNIFKKYKNKTIIFISHRLDNLDLFDDLIKINEGEIYE